jgi:AbrB family looped-hinge helix DNA binding protein
MVVDLPYLTFGAISMETKLSSKGQIVIPRQIRQNHGWKQGVCFSIIDDGDSIVLKPVISREITLLADVIGCAGYDGPKKSLAEMDAGVLEEAQRQAKKWSR